MQRFRRACLVAILGWGVASCIIYQPHVWTEDARFDDRVVEFVAHANLSWVQEKHRVEVIGCLDSCGFLPLSPEEYAHFARDTRSLREAEQAYLTRGVAWSNPAYFAIVALDRPQRTLYVRQFTNTMELFIPGRRVGLASPMVVVLDVELERVIPGAITGGDRILSMGLDSRAFKGPKEDIQPTALAPYP